MKNMNQISLAAQIESLPLFRIFIRDSCSRYALVDHQTVYDIQLAVEEACTNIISHGYAEMDPGSIILAIEFNTDRIRVKITDFGQAFEPVEIPPPDVEAVLQGGESGGFGLFLIHETMDEVLYESTAFGNSMIFIKQLK